jgi:hypothetical protein
MSRFDEESERVTARRCGEESERVTARHGRRDDSLTPLGLRGEPGHSGFGIASVAIAASVIVLEVAMMGLWLVSDLPTDPMAMDPRQPLVVFIACSQWSGLGLCVLALVLAVAGLFQPHRNRVFPVLGIGLNLAILLMSCGLVTLSYLAPEMYR